jgi:hypothetical protein
MRVGGLFLQTDPAKSLAGRQFAADPNDLFQQKSSKSDADTIRRTTYASGELLNRNIQGYVRTVIGHEGIHEILSERSSPAGLAGSFDPVHNPAYDGVSDQVQGLPPQ